ncbi:MAG: polymer-forming cytoskeletal protein, partial [Ginsengibacter sp.]
PIILLQITLAPYFSIAQVGINPTNTPPAANAMLDVNSPDKGVLIPRIPDTFSIPSPTKGMMFFNTTTNKFNFFNGTKWDIMSSRWTVNGSSINYATGNVGINTPNPAYKLQVTGNSYFDGFVGINDTNPDWELDVNGRGSITNFGINGASPNATYPLDVSGNTRVSGNLTVTENATVSGTVTENGKLTVNDNAVITGNLVVNNNHGVAYNPSSANNLKIYRFTTGVFHAVLGPNGSGTTTIAFGGGFTTAPTVLVGDINSTGGTAGELDRVILVLRGCDTNSCIAKIINTDNASVNYDITWNCVAIGY